MLNQEAINEFKQIYFEEYGKIISDIQAVEMGMNLLNAVKFLYQPQKHIDIDKENQPQ